MKVVRQDVKKFIKIFLICQFTNASIDQYKNPPIHQFPNLPINKNKGLLRDFVLYNDI